MKIHILSPHSRPYHLAFSVYGDLRGICGKDLNGLNYRKKAYPGEEKMFCKRCLKNSRSNRI